MINVTWFQTNIGQQQYRHAHAPAIPAYMPATPTPAPAAENNMVELLISEIKDMKGTMEDERRAREGRRAREQNEMILRLQAQVQDLTRNYQDDRRMQDRAIHGNQFPTKLPTSSTSIGRSPFSPERSGRGRPAAHSDSHAPRPPLPTGGHNATGHLRPNGGVQKSNPKGKSLWDRMDPQSQARMLEKVNSDAGPRTVAPTRRRASQNSQHSDANAGLTNLGQGETYGVSGDSQNRGSGRHG
jgi:hypothetical protein